MFDGIRLQLRIRKLQRQKRAVEAMYDPKIEKAREDRDWDLDQKLVSELFMERDLIEDQIFSGVAKGNGPR